MEKNDIRQVLKELAFSAELPDHVLDPIVEAAVVVDYPRGAVLFREGSENHNLYLICEGSVVLEMCVPARGCGRRLSLGPGDMVAWSALLGDGQMTSSALVTEDTQCIAISAKKLRALCESNHELGFYLMQRMALTLSRRLLATRIQLLDVFASEPPLRVE